MTNQYLNQTAKDCAEQNRKEIEALTAILNSKVSRLMGQMSNNPRNWGISGDLERINCALRDLLEGDEEYMAYCQAQT